MATSTKELLDEAKQRRDPISANGSAEAVTFLSSRWKAIDTASRNTNIPEKDRPQIFREKSTGQPTGPNQSGQTNINPSMTTTTTSGGNKQQHQSSGTSTPTSKGSPWSGGRRH